METPSNYTNRITDMVVGMSDGLVVPFALATGLSAVAKEPSTIIGAGLAATMLGAIAMGMSRYYGGVMEANHHHHDEEEHPVKEIGFSEDAERVITDEMAKEKAEWAGYMSEYEAEEDITNPILARKSAFNISLAYMAGGVVPLLPYILFTVPADALKYSVALTLICLFIFGYFKGKFTGLNAFACGLRAVVFGSFAALGAYAVATLFR